MVLIDRFRASNDFVTVLLYTHSGTQSSSQGERREIKLTQIKSSFFAHFPTNFLLIQQFSPWNVENVYDQPLFVVCEFFFLNRHLSGSLHHSPIHADIFLIVYTSIRYMVISSISLDSSVCVYVCVQCACSQYNFTIEQIMFQFVLLILSLSFSFTHNKEQNAHYFLQSRNSQHIIPSSDLSILEVKTPN